MKNRIPRKLKKKRKKGYELAKDLGFNVSHDHISGITVYSKRFEPYDNTPVLVKNFESFTLEK